MNLRPLLLRPRPRLLRGLLLGALLALVGMGLYAGATHLWIDYQLRAGRAALQRRDLDQARIHLDRYLQTWPQSAPAHFLRARTARLAGDVDTAGNHLTLCQKHQGSMDAIILERALLRLQQGELTAGLEKHLWSYVNENHPETGLILEALSQALTRAYRLHSALACLDRWLEHEPDSLSALERRGWVYERLHDFDKATAEYRRMLTLDAGHLIARLRLAQILLLSSRGDETAEAVAILEQLRAEQPHDPRVALALAQGWMRASRMEEARQLLDEATAAHPREAPLLLARGQLALELKDHEEAESWLRRAVDFDPFDYQANYALALALDRQGKATYAREQHQRAESIKADLARMNELTERLQKRPYDPGLRCEIGRMFLRHGQKREGVLWLNSALQADPHNRAAHQALAEYYEASRQPALAEPHRRFLGQDQ